MKTRAGGEEEEGGGAEEEGGGAEEEGGGAEEEGGGGEEDGGTPLLAIAFWKVCFVRIVQQIASSATRSAAYDEKERQKRGSKE